MAPNLRFCFREKAGFISSGNGNWEYSSRRWSVGWLNRRLLKCRQSVISEYFTENWTEDIYWINFGLTIHYALTIHTSQSRILFCISNFCKYAALLVAGPGIDSQWCHWGFFYLVTSDKTMCPEVESASENEYQGFLLG